MDKQKVVIEISDGNETKQFPTYQSAAEYFKIPSTFTIFYALKHNKPSFKRRSDKKVFTQKNSLRRQKSTKKRIYFI